MIFPNAEAPELVKCFATWLKTRKMEESSTVQSTPRASRPSAGAIFESDWRRAQVFEGPP